MVLSSTSVDYVLGLRASNNPVPGVESLPWCIPIRSREPPLRALVPIRLLAGGSIRFAPAFAAQYQDGSVVFIEVDPACTGSPTTEESDACLQWSPDLLRLEGDYQRSNKLVNDVAATTYISLHGRWAWQGALALVTS